MVVRSLVVALVLFTPTVAQTPPHSGPFAIRACVQQGTHGSVANLSDAEAVAPTVGHATRRTLYWFSRDVDRFKNHVGQKVEVLATVIEIIDEAREFQATDGVFAEVEPKPSGVELKPVAVTGSPAPAERSVGTSGDEVVEHPVVVKATVTGLRMVGFCR
ncbi:MAG: hypothetical protein FJW27_04495 [Acidimicrobiia bacterium]|nr:hypothetical protein [Acidimicrobiia bacterium]